MHTPWQRERGGGGGGGREIKALLIMVSLGQNKTAQKTNKY